MTTDAWNSLDMAAAQNLDPTSLCKFYDYKQDLYRHGASWEYAEDILRRFIWEYSEEPYIEEEED